MKKQLHNGSTGNTENLYNQSKWKILEHFSSKKLGEWLYVVGDASTRPPSVNSVANGGKGKICKIVKHQQQVRVLGRGYIPLRWGN